MKKSPDYEKLKSRLDASKFSGAGFLGSDERPVDEIIADDLHLMEINKINKSDLIIPMKVVYEKVKAELGRKVQLSDGISGEFFESMGRIPSPFVGDGVFEKGEVVIIDENTNDRFVITALAINLIDKHNFFQGKGSRYRLEPLKLAKLFNNLDY